MRGPLIVHFKLSAHNSPKIDQERVQMGIVPYVAAVESIMYAMVCTRPDLAHAISVVSRYMANPDKLHWFTVKWILRYLKGTSKLGLKYKVSKDDRRGVVGYVDEDFATDLDRKRSLTRYLFIVHGSVLSWKASLQHVVALTTTESEYIATTEAVEKDKLLHGLTVELKIKQDSMCALWQSKCDIFRKESNIS